MNVETRLIHQSVSQHQLDLTYAVSKRQVVVCLLSFAVLFSALGVIYVTHFSRIVYSEYQHQLIEQDHLHVIRTQLLLERSAWMAPSRVEKMAIGKLDMVTPDDHTVVIVRE